MAESKKVVLAYSGGLDTSYCIPYLQETAGYEVITVTVNTGGFSAQELEAIEGRARQLGAIVHHTVDARARVFDRYVTYLIKGNVLRGDVYPLSVAAERVAQAEAIAEIARQEGAVALAHGSTGAGNDQVRFDIAFSVLLPGMPILTPIRDQQLTREQEFQYLEERGIHLDRSVRKYSINSGLWGATIGGGETHDPGCEIPPQLYDQALNVQGTTETTTATENLVLGFSQGVPQSLDGVAMSGVDLVAELGERCRRHRVGCGVHIGDTVLGIKGRVAFEAGAAVVSIHAHRELEKITLTGWQRFWKDHVAEFYGKLLHEGNAFDPVLRDIEALIDSSQQRVSGEATVRLGAGDFQITAVSSPFSMVRAASGVYGEMPKLWTGADVRGFSTMVAISSRLYLQAGEGEP